MKFGSLIASKKYLTINGVGVTLLCISSVVEATNFVVTNPAGTLAGGTLSTAIVNANADGGLGTITFDVALGANPVVGIVGGGATISANMLINGTAPANLELDSGNWSTPMFNVNPGVILTLGSNNDAIHSGTNIINWFGSMANNGTILFNQFASTKYCGSITGSGKIQYASFDGSLGIVLTLVNDPGLLGTGLSTYTGGTDIFSGTISVGVTNALPQTGIVNISGVNSALTIGGGFSQTLGGLTGNGGLNINGTSLTINSNGNNTYSGIATGTGAFIKQGTGTQTLSGLNTANGIMTINNGTTRIAPGGRWNGNVQITSIGGPATLEMNGGTVTGIIIGDGTVNSNLDVSGAFAPTTVITNVGKINVKPGGNLTINPGFVPVGFQALNIDALGDLTLGTNFTVPTNVTLTNNGTVTMGGNNILMNTGSTLTNNGTLSTTGTIGLAGGATSYNLNVGNGGLFTVNNAVSGYTALAVTTGGTVVLNNPGSLSNGIALNNGVFTYNGGVFNGNVTDTGASTMNVNGNFGIPGTVAVNTLNVNNGGTFTSNASTAITTLLNVDNGGTLLLNSNLTTPVNGTLTTAGTLTMNNYNLLMRQGSTLNVNTSNLVTSGTIGLASGATSYELNVVNNGILTVNNPVTGYTNPLLVTTGGRVELNLGGSLSNSLSLNGGTFIVNGGTYSGDVIGTIGTGSRMEINTSLTPPGAISVDLLDISPFGSLTLSRNLTTPLNGELLNAGTLSMNGFNLLMSTNSTLTNMGILSTNGSIGLASGATGYTLIVGTNDGPGTLTVNNPVTGYTAPLTVSNGSNVILNNGGTLSNSIDLNDSIFTINGGTFNGNITGNAASTLNINNAFTAPGVVNVDTLNVNNGATFTPSNAVITLTGLNVNLGGTLLLTNNIGGNVTNAGTITHTANAVRTITGNFTQAASGIMNVAITDPQQYSQFQVNGNTVLNGGVMNVALSSTTVIDGGEVFNIINSTGPLTVNALPTVPDSSLFLDFVPAVNGNILQLTANRIPYEDVNTIPELDGVAKGLDGLIKDSDYDPVLGMIDRIQTVSEYEALLGQLAPVGLNGGITTPQLGGAEQILVRLDSLREGDIGVLAKTGYTKTGYAAGDMLENQASYGPIVFGSSVTQSGRGGLPGYKAFTGGFGLLGDVPILQYFRVGLGASYANSSVKQSDNTGNKTSIGSAQGLAYGSAAYGPLFLDAVLSVGMNNYNGKKNIIALGQTATSSYKGFQYGGKVKAGFTIPCYQIELSPMGTVQYMHLNVGSYTEKGAGVLNQSQSAIRTSTVRVGLGGRIADKSQEEDFFPEIHAFYIVDVKNPNLTITSRFVDGGGSFQSTGVLPPKSGFTVGGSISALVVDNFMVIGGYDLEAKKSYRSHSASLKFKWLF